MADDDSDFTDILEGTVDEVKDRIRDLDSPDYEGLLEAEEDGKDRKTVKEFLQSRIGDGDEKEEEDETETVEAEEPEEVVEDIERETEGGFLGSFSKTSVLAGGLILGLVLGFAAAGLTGTNKVNAQMVQQDVKKLASGGSFNGTVEISQPEVRHSMYYFNVTRTQQVGNKTRSGSIQVYVTLDGEYLFPVRRQFGRMISPIQIKKRLAEMKQQKQQSPSRQTQEPATNTSNTTQ